MVSPSHHQVEYHGKKTQSMMHRAAFPVPPDRARYELNWLLCFLVCSSLMPSANLVSAAEPRKTPWHISARSPISDGWMVVCWNRETRHSRNLLVHFHGAPQTMEKPFLRSGLDAILAVVNFPGLSRAYSTPFRQDRRLFETILEQAAQTARTSTATHGEVGTDSRWQHLWVSSFSAGYGAVREILKTPAYFERIDGIVAADSIYAGLEQGVGHRAVNRQHMKDFLRFATLASEGKKGFILSHSALATPYASTAETADYLLAKLHGQRQPGQAIERPGLKQTSRTAKGRFIVLGFAGTTGRDHMRHLANIDLLWKQLTVKPGP